MQKWSNKILNNVLWNAYSVMKTNCLLYHIDCYVFRQILSTLSNKIFITLLWYAYSMAKNKLLIILTNLTGSYLDCQLCVQRNVCVDCYVFRQILSTLSNKIFITLLWYAYSMARNKLLTILTNLTGSYLDCQLCVKRNASYVSREMFALTVMCSDRY